jgi:ribosomal protein S12 methylthiotransferase accessory factor YcaO-like protein
MESTLQAALERTSRLPDGWSELEIVEDTVLADGVELHRAGVASKGPDGQEVTGSAACASASPARRSYFELLERAATHEAHRARRGPFELLSASGERVGGCSAREVFPESEAPALWRYAKSNGVALHVSWESAARGAFWELCERDRVLRAWYGSLRPRPIDLDVEATPLARAQSYAWTAVAFPEEDRHHFSSSVHVVAVFGFPRRAHAPLIMGYGARPALELALACATSEAMQSLAFLWGEPLNEGAPKLGPTPMHHLEYFQYPGHHGLLRRWLDGEHVEHARRATRSVAAGAGERAHDVAFVDVTPSWLNGGFRVAKAHCPTATPLAFGDAPFGGHLPEHLRIHPIA